MIDEKALFDQPFKSNFRTYDSIQKLATGQGDGYTTGCLLDYTYSKKYYKMIIIDLRKQQSNLKVIQQINFTGNLNAGQNVNDNTTMFSIIEEAKETILDF